jgi:hypothetical protein
MCAPDPIAALAHHQDHLQLYQVKHISLLLPWPLIITDSHVLDDNTYPSLRAFMHHRIRCPLCRVRLSHRGGGLDDLLAPLLALEAEVNTKVKMCVMVLDSFMVALWWRYGFM